MTSWLTRVVAHVRNTLAAQHEDVPYDWFSEAEVSAYFASLAEATDLEVVDRQTYHDLDFPKYARFLLKSASIFARQYFEHAVRCGSSCSDAETFMNGALALAAQPEACERAVQQLRPLRQVRQEAASVLFRPEGATLPVIFARLRYADCIGIFLCCTLVLLPSAAAIGLVAAFGLFSFKIQIQCYRALKLWTSRRDALHQLCRAAVALAARPDLLPDAIFDDSPLSDVRSIAEVTKRLRPSLLSRSPATAEYANLLFLYEYAQASRESNTVKTNLPSLQAVFRAVSRLELQIAVAQAIRSGLPLCRPDTRSATPMSFNGLVHPLVQGASAMSFETRTWGLFISGQNGAGKSTLLRAVGLSVATHRAFGYAHARAAALPRGAVWSSMQLEDSIDHRRSLYMSEMQRAALLLSVAAAGRPVVFLIDELFRGTNHVESVAASASVLSALATSGIVLTASHNIVLAALLEGTFGAMRVVKDPSGLIRAEHGVIAETNGVELMSSYGIDARLIESARRVGHWYGQYIAHPGSVPRGIIQSD